MSSLELLIIVELGHVLNRKLGSFGIVQVGPEKSHFYCAKTCAKPDPLTSPPGFAWNNYGCASILRELGEMNIFDHDQVGRH